MKAFSEASGRGMRAFTMLTFSTICLLMVAGVVNRFMPLGSMGWSDEITELLLVWTLFIGIAEVWRSGQHFRVDLLPELLRGRPAGRILDGVLLFGSLAFLLVFIWQSGELMLAASDVSPIFSWSRRWWYLPMPLAGLIMAAVTLHAIVGLRHPVPTARHAVPPSS